MIQLIRRYHKTQNDGAIGQTPGLDVIMVIILAPILAVVDFTLTWFRLYREAEEAKRRSEKQVLNEDSSDKIY